MLARLRCELGVSVARPGRFEADHGQRAGEKAGESAKGRLREQPLGAFKHVPRIGSDDELILEQALAAPPAKQRRVRK